ncbi:MAG: rhodanese-like domain-containing protein [Rhizobiaceae bacterium]|nr:rhodanese-like domain-containing protein [Rhizobiaceae bacterium]
MKFFRLLISVTLVSLIIVVSNGISNATDKMSAPDALREIEAGNMILLDIRSPGEWKETGVASVAVPLTMHSKTFIQGYEKIVSENPGKKIGIICAVGGRTAWLQAELAKRGLGDVTDIAEGMLGSKAGPGWIARGMEMKKVE